MPDTDRPPLLLINPWIYDFSAFDLWMKPLGLLYLAAHLRSAGFPIHLIDCLDRYAPALLLRQGRRSAKSRQYGVGKFFRAILEKPSIFRQIPANYSCYGLPEDLFLDMLQAIPVPAAILITSGMTYWYPGVFRAIALAHRAFPGVPVILGGMYARLRPEHARRYAQAEYVLTEHAPHAILNAVYDILGIPGDSPAPRSLFERYPAFDLYPRAEYAVLLTSLGCPYRCSYCASHVVAPEFTQRPPQDVFREFLHDYDNLGIHHFAVYDDALLVNGPDHIDTFMQQVIESGRAATFHTPNGLHARYMTAQTADLMFRSGFRTIRLSLETVNPARQRDTGGKVRSAELAHAVRCLKQAGFRGDQIGVYLFLGLPGQPLAETEETVRYVHSLGVQARLCEYSPIPGTADWAILKQRGVVADEDDPLIHNNSVFLLHTRQIDFQQMQRLKDRVRALNRRILEQP